MILYDWCLYDVCKTYCLASAYLNSSSVVSGLSDAWLWKLSAFDFQVHWKKYCSFSIIEWLWGAPIVQLQGIFDFEFLWRTVHCMHWLSMRFKSSYFFWQKFLLSSQNCLGLLGVSDLYWNMCLSVDLPLIWQAQFHKGMM